MGNPLLRTYRLSRTFAAPMDFVFDWCTDFRGENGEYEGPPRRRRSYWDSNQQQEFIWAVRYKDGKKVEEGVRAVWLHPPDSWYLDASGQGKEVGDYKLTREDKERTRLDIELTVAYDSAEEAEDEQKWSREWGERWDCYKAMLEKDYRATVRD